MKKKTTLFAVILIAGLAAGCGQTQQESDLSAAEETEQIQEDGVQDGESVPEGQAGDKVSAEGFSFADVADREFYFSSGAGGWYTVLYIHEDGSFEMIRRAETPRDYFATFDCFPVFEKLLQDEDELK